MLIAFPVLPLIASTMVSPGRSKPSRSARSIMYFRDACLDRSGGVEVLELDPYPIHDDQGRVADRVQDRAAAYGAGLPRRTRSAITRLTHGRMCPPRGLYAHTPICAVGGRGVLAFLPRWQASDAAVPPGGNRHLIPGGHQQDRQGTAVDRAAHGQQARSLCVSGPGP